MESVLGRYGFAARLCNLTGAILVIGLLSGGNVRAQTVILAFGDSLTAGFGLKQSEGFVPKLEAWLQSAGHDVAVRNGGVSGDTTSGGRARIGWALEDDVDAVIVELGGNDFLRGLPPAAARDNLDAILAEVTGRGLPVLLAGLPAPPNYGSAYKAEFDAIFPELAAKHGALYYPDFFAELRKEGTFAGVPALMQGDGIHPNAAGVLRIVAGIGPVVSDLLATTAASR